MRRPLRLPPRNKVIFPLLDKAREADILRYLRRNGMPAPILPGEWIDLHAFSGLVKVRWFRTEPTSYEVGELR